MGDQDISATALHIDAHDAFPAAPVRSSPGASPIAPQRHPVASINSLPMELCERILELGIEDFRLYEVDVRKSQAFLLSVCQVSTRWNSAAQPLIWRDIWIRTEQEAVRLLESPVVKRYKTVRFGVGSVGNMQPDLSAHSLTALFDQLQGLQHLEIADLAPLKISTLCHSSLRGMPLLFPSSPVKR